jgi:hypothetical protein
MSVEPNKKAPQCAKNGSINGIRFALAMLQGYCPRN